MVIKEFRKRTALQTALGGYHSGVAEVRLGRSVIKRVRLVGNWDEIIKARRWKT